MVAKIIRDYMERGAKKLTVPGFGTFMRREGGEVIFVDLLRGDDHTLSEMVEDAGGYSVVEAMALIDRFIFETKNAIERNGSAAIEGFGIMTIDHKGVYQFDYSPKSRPMKENAVQERLFGAESSQSTKPARPVHAPRPAQPRRQEPASAARKPTASAESRPLHSSPRNTRNKPHGKKRRKPDYSGVDKTLIFAIVAAVIAIIAMIFAFSAGNMPFLSK